MEKSGSSLVDEHVRDSIASRGDPENGHAVRTATKSGDVSLNPLQRYNLIESAHVGHCKVRVREVPEKAQSIVNLDEDHSFVRQGVGTRLVWLLRAAVLVIASAETNNSGTAAAAG